VQVVAGHHRYGRDDVEAVESRSTSLAARLDVLQLLSQIGGVVEDAEPAVGDLAGELEVLGADRGQVDRHVVADRPDGQLQRLARSVRQREGEVLALVRDGLAAEGGVHDGNVLTRPEQRLREPDAVPALRHLRPGHAETEPEPPVRQPVQGGRGHRGHRRGASRDLEHRRADVDRGGLGGDPAEQRGGVRAVRLRRPGDRESEPLGLSHQPQMIQMVVAAEDEADVESESHDWRA
jgi:hypothetical protein